MTVSWRKTGKKKSSSGQRKKRFVFAGSILWTMSASIFILFKEPDRFSDDELAAFTEAVEALTSSCEAREQQPQSLKYIKLD